MKQATIVLFSVFVITSISFFNVNKSISQLTDRDGNSYNTITIGTQEWMAENLNVEHYRNGDLIPQVQDGTEWGKLSTGAWCYYENNSEIGKKYGKLYNWYAVNDPRGLAPEGWHIPSDSEWTVLTDYLGGLNLAGGKLKATSLWDIPNEGATNNSGFTAIPGGMRYFFSGRFDLIGKYSCFWSSSEYTYYSSWHRYMYCYGSVVSRSNSYSKEIGLSVRCLRGEKSETEAYIQSPITNDTIVNEDILSAKEYFHYGFVNFMFENYEVSIQYFTKAIEVNPNLEDVYYCRGTAYLNLKDYSNAISDFDITINNNSNIKAAYINRGNAYNRLQNYSKAISDYDKSIELEPENYMPYFNRGNVYAHLQDYFKAISDYNKAIEFNPNFGEAYYDLGNAYNNLKDYSEAISNYDKAIKIISNDGQLYCNRGDAYARTGNMRNACEDWRKAYSLGNSEAKELLDKYCK